MWEGWRKRHTKLSAQKVVKFTGEPYNGFLTHFDMTIEIIVLGLSRPVRLKTKLFILHHPPHTLK